MPSTITHHSFSATEQCSHQGFWKREREGGKPFIFQKKTFKTPKKQEKFTQGKNSSGFSLLKWKSEKRCCWEPPLFQNPAALQHKRDVVGSWEKLMPWCHTCHAFGWDSRWLSSDMAEIAFLSKFDSRGGRLFTVASASCQLSWHNRWPCCWSWVLKALSSDAENRQEQPPDRHTHLCMFMTCHTLIFCPNAKLARAHLFINLCLQRGLFDPISLYYQPLVRCAGSTDLHKCAWASMSCQTLQKHNFLSANHVTLHELTELELRAQNDRA